MEAITADDEPKIRRGLSKVLPWEELGIELVGEAENGLQALAIAASGSRILYLLILHAVCSGTGIH